jgi:hypothetical protein
MQKRETKKFNLGHIPTIAIVKRIKPWTFVAFNRPSG